MVRLIRDISSEVIVNRGQKYLQYTRSGNISLKRLGKVLDIVFMMLVVRPVGGAGEAAVHEDALVAGAAVELHGGADLDQSEASTGLSNNQSQLTSPPRNRQVSPSPTQRSVASPGAPSSSRGWVCDSAVVVCSDSLHVLSINIYLSEAKHKVPQSPGSTSDSLLSV